MTENVVRTRFESRRYLPVVALGIAIALAGAIVAWLLLRSDAPPPSEGPALVSQGQLERLAGSVDYPVYWAGPKRGFSYELTATKDGRIFVRYLPAGVEAGDPRPDFLTVGTYTRPRSFADLKLAAGQKDAVSVRIENGGLMVFNSKKPTNVYFSYPGAKYQVEVFTRSRETARSLVLTGQITPLDS